MIPDIMTGMSDWRTISGLVGNHGPGPALVPNTCIEVTHFHDQVWSEGSHASNTDAGLRGSIGGADTWKIDRIVSRWLTEGETGEIVPRYFGRVIELLGEEGREGLPIQPKIMAAAMPAWK
jgi:hypothetical protein